MDYDILQAGDLLALSRLVKAQTEKGWEPLGGAQSFNLHQRDPNGHEWVETWFMQTMVLKA